MPLGIAIALALPAACGGLEVETPNLPVQTAVQPINDLPNPYQRIEPWAQLPEDLESWPQVTAAEPGPDGNIYVFYRSQEPAGAIVKFARS